MGRRRAAVGSSTARRSARRRGSIPTTRARPRPPSLSPPSTSPRRPHLGAEQVQDLSTVGRHHGGRGRAHRSPPAACRPLADALRSHHDAPTRQACTVPAPAAQSSAAASAGAGDTRAERSGAHAGVRRSPQQPPTVQQAAQRREDSVTVVAVDDHGRPSSIDAPLDQAVDVALATAQRLDVVAVERRRRTARRSTPRRRPRPRRPPPQPTPTSTSSGRCREATPLTALVGRRKAQASRSGIVDSGAQG